MKQLNSVALALVTTALAACGEPGPDAGGPDPSPAFGAQHAALYIAETTRWPDPVIPVCWEDARADHVDERRWVRQAVEESWAGVSLVEFAGWGDCREASDGIRITVGEVHPHVKGLGRRLDGVRDGMALNFEFQTWSPDCQNNRRYCIQTIAVHEFGHALGFAHEHNRPDTPDTCDDQPQGSDGDTLAGPWDLDSVMNYCNPAWSGDGQLSEGDVAGVQAVYGTALWSDQFGAADGWDPARHIRLMGDVDGDGTDDVVGFAENGVYVAQAIGGRLTPYARWVRNFAAGAGGWRVDRHPRVLADVDGDGRADIVGFGAGAVLVSLSTGDGFTQPRAWLDDLGYGQGWRLERHVRAAGDIDGDGRDDLIAFGHGGVYVALSEGDRFGPLRLVLERFGVLQGWEATDHLRVLGDVNGDGRVDLVGFGPDGTYLATGRLDGRFTWRGRQSADLGRNRGWTVDRHPRMLADVDGDGRDDVVGFGGAGVFVGRSLGNRLAEPHMILGAFGAGAGGGQWDPERHIRLVGDVDGDGRADVVGFGERETVIARGNADARFEDPRLWILGMTPDIGGWQVARNPRTLADMDGDGALDVVGFANAGVAVFVY